LALAQIQTVDENLERILTVELRQRDPSASVLLSLLVEEGVEPADNVVRYRRHRTRTVENNGDVHWSLVAHDVCSPLM
jgi:hypothetical protein